MIESSWSKPAWRGFSCSSLMAIGVLGLLAPAAGAADRYYMLMFGSQRVPNDPNYSHSWATFVRVRPVGPAPAPPRLESFSISWMPATLEVQAFRLFPEEGANLDLVASLRLAYYYDERVSLWGPYPIHPELYVRAIRRAQHLQSGCVLYKAVDFGYDSDRVTNCIHAIGRLTEGARVRVPKSGWGETASYELLQDLSPWVLDDCPQLWVSSALGLDVYPIIYRPWEHPRSGQIRGFFAPMFGREREVTPVIRAQLAPCPTCPP